MQIDRRVVAGLRGSARSRVAPCRANRRRQDARARETARPSAAACRFRAFGSPWRNTGRPNVASVMKTSHAHQLERRAGRIGDVLVVAGRDDAQCRCTSTAICAEPSTWPAGWNVTVAPPSVDASRRSAIACVRAGEILAVAQPHQVERLLRRQHRAVAGARVVGMAMGDTARSRPAGSDRYGSRRAGSKRPAGGGIKMSSGRITSDK